MAPPYIRPASQLGIFTAELLINPQPQSLTSKISEHPIERFPKYTQHLFLGSLQQVSSLGSNTIRQKWGLAENTLDYPLVI
jgi:hypothetical protein